MKAMSLCVAALTVGLLTACNQAEPKTGEPAPADKPTETTMEREEAPVSTQTDEVAVIKTTMGEMVIKFWPDVAPNTVANFKKLSQDGFYNGTAFHRIMRGFMIQGGDPLTKDLAAEERWGTGDPGYKIKAEFNNRSHQFGVISMARSQDPDSAGSQFFICLGDASGLDGQYTAFGELIKGEEALRNIGNVPTEYRGSGGSRERSKPLTRVEVQSIEIVPAGSVQ